jgi:putative ABC transport system permease protein
MRSNLTLTAFAWKNVWRRRMRAALTLSGIAMGICAFVALVGFSRSFESGWRTMYQSAGTDLIVVQKSFMNTTVNEDVGPSLLAVPGVARIAPMTVNMLSVTPETNALVYGWVPGAFEFSALTMTQGRPFQDSGPELMLGELLAQSLNKKAGDSMDIEGSSFKVVAVYHGGSALEAGAIIMPLAQMQKLSSLEGKVTAFHLQLKPPPAGVSAEDQRRMVQAQIESRLPGLSAVPAAERAGNNQLVVLAHAAAWGTSLIALLVGALGIANTMAMSVFERTLEIGVLRSLGWPSGRVMTLILVEAAGLGFAGGILGVAMGIVALRILAALPETASIASASLPWLTLLEAIGAAVLIALAAGTWPAWRASRLSPVEAMRHD